jgi:hypothetical protein
MSYPYLLQKHKLSGRTRNVGGGLGATGCGWKKGEKAEKSKIQVILGRSKRLDFC